MSYITDPKKLAIMAKTCCRHHHKCDECGYKGELPYEVCCLRDMSPEVVQAMHYGMVRATRDQVVYEDENWVIKGTYEGDLIISAFINLNYLDEMRVSVRDFASWKIDKVNEILAINMDDPREDEECSEKI